MRKKLQNGHYNSFEAFEFDAKLVFSNAMTYNQPSTIYYQEANKLSGRVKDIFKNARLKLEKPLDGPGRKPKPVAMKPVDTFVNRNQWTPQPEFS